MYVYEQSGNSDVPRRVCLRKRSIVKEVQHRIEYAAVVIISGMFRAMPLIIAYGITKVLGFCAFHVFRVRRDVTLDNLRNALGQELDERELRKIASRSYFNVGLTFIEMLLMPKLRGRIHEIIDVSDIGIAKKASDRGKGVIVVSAHFGGWEMNGGTYAPAGLKMNVVAKSQSNRYIDKFVNRNRELFNVKVITTGASIKHLVKALRNGEVIGLISDQDAGRKGVFVDFFSRKASTVQGAAQLALKYNAPIVVTMTARTGPFRFKAFFREVDVLPDDTITTLTQRYTKVMEDIIRRYPDQYFWMHRRWKTAEG